MPDDNTKELITMLDDSIQTIRASIRELIRTADYLQAKIINTQMLIQEYETYVDIKENTK